MWSVGVAAGAARVRLGLEGTRPGIPFSAGPIVSQSGRLRNPLFSAGKMDSRGRPAWT